MRIRSSEFALSGLGAGLVLAQVVRVHPVTWVPAALVPLVALGWLPDIGPMKTAEARAKAGQPVPDDDALEARWVPVARIEALGLDLLDRVAELARLAQARWRQEPRSAPIAPIT